MNLSSSYSDLFKNNSLIISHPRNASTSPKKTQLKDQIIQQLSTLISLELNKIDSREIETKFSIYFNLNENDKSLTYIQSLCSKISETKKSINNKLKNFLNHNINALIENLQSENNNISTINTSLNNIENEKNKFKSILKEIKVLNNNSRIKYKKLYDNLSNEYDKILSTIYDYMQKGNTKLVIDRLNRIEQLKNDVLFDVTSIENIQNKFTDSIKNIINKTGNENEKNIKHSLNRTKTGFFTFHKNNNKSLNFDLNYNKSEFNLHNKVNKNKFDVSNFNTYGNNVHTIMGKDVHKNHHINNKEENNCVKVYINKLKEKKNEIERLKQQLLQEKENKTKVINELNKLQFFNKMSLSIKESQKNLTKEEKFNKLIEMIINFTYSMNTLRNNLYQKTISHIDAKNIYGKLKTKLISLIDEVPSIKNSLLKDNNKDEELNEENNNNENKDDIKTIKEENENSQIFTDRENNYSNKKQPGGNIVNNNITLNTLPNYNMQILLEENKNLRNQLYNSTENNINNEQEKNMVESLKKQIAELKKIIIEKDKELEDKRFNSIKTQKEELSNIINNNTKNIEQLKTTYQILIDDKDNRIKELEEEIISYEKEIDTIKEENDKLKNECRKDKILSEAEVNNLKNQKIELQCLLEHSGSNNSIINLNNKDEQVKKMENELNIKNKQIILLTQNHENDLKELNLSIEKLKQKIIQLQENEESTKINE